jgi:cytoskeleton protein RodZ
VFDIGTTLRDARTRQGLDFPELEQITKIRPKYLRALEDERFDILPAPTYVRGFLRSYAEALGLEPQPFVDEYNSRFTVGDEEQEPTIRPRRAPAPRVDRSRRESRIAVLALLGIAVVTALVIAAFRFGGPAEEKVPGLAVQGQGGAGTIARGHATLVVRAVGGSSWMEVRSGGTAGKLLWSGTLQPGHPQEFRGSRLQLALSEPQNVSVRLNGRRVQLPAGTAFVVTARRIASASS